jgi:prolyl-tRNA synthetase
VLEKVRRRAIATLADSQPVLVPVGMGDADWARLLQSDLQSYRSLPILLRGERRLGSDSTLAAPSFAIEWVQASEGTDESAGSSLREAFDLFFRELGVGSIPVRGRDDGRSWAVRAEGGELEALECPTCHDVALRSAAAFARGESEKESPSPTVEVETPDAHTIGRLASVLGVEPRRTLKAMFYELADREMVLAVVRGDLEVEIPKLEAAVGRRVAGTASEEAIRRSGSIPGYASPIGLRVRPEPDSAGLWVIGDTSLETMVNFVVGANRQGFHITGANYPRDFSVTHVADIARAEAGSPCSDCGSALLEWSGVELASFTARREVLHYAGKDGDSQGGTLAIGRLFPEMVILSAVESLPEPGLPWGRGLAPFDVHLLMLVDSPEAHRLSGALAARGLEVLLDDRDLSAGVRLVDADWIGAPCRVVVGKRSLERGGVEVRLGGKEGKIVAWDDALGVVTSHFS